jgi:hypothetical protein
MRFMVVREALPACIHVTVIQPVVDIAIQNTQRNDQHSGDLSFVCVRLSDTSICTTHIAIRNGRTRRGPGCCLSTCSALIERVIPYPHLFPWRYKCFVNFHELAWYFQRYGILHTQIYEVIWRCILWNALFQLWNSMTDYLEVRCQGYFIGDFPIFKFSEWVIAYCSTAGKCMRYEERNPAGNWLSLLTLRCVIPVVYGNNTKNSVCVCVCVCVYIYIYIYSVKTHHHQIRATTCFGPADGPSSGCS